MITLSDRNWEYTWSELQKMKGEIAPIVMEICNEKKY